MKWSRFPRKFRWWIFRAIEALACFGPRFGKRPGPPRGMVVIRMDGIGDMVLFRRSLDHYAEIFGIPRSEITVLGCQSWAGLADELFADYTVAAIDEHRFHKKMGYRLKVSRWIHGQNFRVAVLDSFFRKPLMADSLMMASRAPEKVTIQPWISAKTRDLFAYSLSRATQVVETGPYPLHETVRHYRFLSAIAGREIAPEPVRLDWPVNAPPVPAGKPYAVLNFGSNEYGRRWPLAEYLELARWLLAETDLRIVFCGGSNDIIHAPEIRAALNEDARVIDLIGKTKLPALMDLLNGAALVLTNDTGPAHLAMALGVPTLTLVGGGHFGSFVPYPDAVRPANARFLHVEMECYHCFWSCPKRADDRQSYPCVAAISQYDVRAVLKELLEVRPAVKVAAEVVPGS